MREGGNAIDAAITAAAVLAVVEPQSTGIGGDAFMLYAPGGGPGIIAYNGSGRAPAAASPDWYHERGIRDMPQDGPHSVTIPGVIDAWARLAADHGTRGLDRLLGPAIRYAEEGYLIADRVAFDWAACAEALRTDADAARTLLPWGRPPRPGDRHVQPALGATLRAVAASGRKAFYEGPIAEDMVSALRSRGGLHTLDDFATAAGEYTTPISTRYRGVDVFELPPSNQAITALIMLNILDGFDMAGLDPFGAERLHLEIEAARLAYADRNAFVADPAQASVPVEELLSAGHARELRARIDPRRAMVDLPPPRLRKSDTVYLCVVDRDRNAASFINSTYASFGSMIVAPASGVVLQNRGACFTLDPSHPNRIAPRKRPMHTIMPGMALRNGRVMMPFGVMGGDFQPFGHAHLLTNMIDFGLDPQAALDAPRVFHEAGMVAAERGIPAAALAGLQDRGHRTLVSYEPHGGGQAISIDWEAGTLTAGSDPRKDGCALGY
ncbi:gamma-glutamyltranspeptidase/glutathione hydrolase [Labrys wisconsinensis]|uniref:Gamma-glutamyltranspeptidase/glutathione hydrolase n=1 Tax=Labrys wisconsinensis TaxID=425677 RepID=A0ABU0JJ68_9HYPH|nr:gamma-glutamyltranspeptidase/glutathione hydrolase [Labrys wisconsinensis]